MTNIYNVFKIWNHRNLHDYEQMVLRNRKSLKFYNLVDGDVLIVDTHLTLQEQNTMIFRHRMGEDEPAQVSVMA